MQAVTQGQELPLVDVHHITFLASERRVPGEREEGAQAEEQQRQEGAIAEPHLLRYAVGAGGAEAAWPGGAGAGAPGPEAAKNIINLILVSTIW